MIDLIKKLICKIGWHGPNRTWYADIGLITFCKTCGKNLRITEYKN